MIRDTIDFTKTHHERLSKSPFSAAQPQRIEQDLRSLANLLVCTSTELAFVQLPSYEAKVDKFEHIIREWLPAYGAASGTPTACPPGRVAGSEPQVWKHVQ